MAYVRDPNEKWQQTQGTGGSNLYSDGTGGIAGGSSGAVSGQSPGASKAGNAAGWYNIQEFLGANKGNQSLQNQIKQTGNEYIEGANQEASGLYDQYNSIAKPDAFQFDANNLKPGGFTEQDAKKGLYQDYDPFDVEGAMNLSQSSMNPYQNIQPGSVESLTQFNKNAMQPNAQYSSGMQNMDNALLGNDYDFVGNYANQFKGDFEQNVLNPFTAQKETFLGQEQARDQAFDTARDSWMGGLNTYLTGQNNAVNSTFNNMKSNYDNTIASAQNDPSQFVDAETKAYIDGQKAAAEKYGTTIDLPSYSDYIRQTGGEFAPNQGQAAYSALGGQEGVDYFNALSSLYGDATSNSENPWERTAYSGSAYTAPSFEFDRDGFWDAIRGGIDIKQSSDQYTAPAATTSVSTSSGVPNIGTSDTNKPGDNNLPGFNEVKDAGTWVDNQVTGGAISDGTNSISRRLPKLRR
jgi:hypothetical protein